MIPSHATRPLVLSLIFLISASLHTTKGEEQDRQLHLGARPKVLLLVNDKQEDHPLPPRA